MACMQRQLPALQRCTQSADMAGGHARRVLAQSDDSHVRDGFSPAPFGIAVESVQQRGQCDPQDGGLDEGRVGQEDAACKPTSFSLLQHCAVSGKSSGQAIAKLQRDKLPPHL